MHLLRNHYAVLRISWLFLLLLIPLLSYSGRSLQHLLNQIISADSLGIILALLLLGIVLSAARWLHQINPSRLWLSLLWFVPLFIFIPLMLPIAIERMHFIVFGMFGFVSLLYWDKRTGLVVCGLMAGLDEVFQWWLPDRVGDMRDVLINLLAVFGGGLFALSGKNKQ